MKKLSPFYFIDLAVLDLMMNGVYRRLSFFDIIFVILAISPLHINKKRIYQIYGGSVFLFCLYILLAIFVSQGMQNQPKHLNRLWTYGIGYVLSLITLCFGLLMTGIININHTKLVVNR
ncbi:hypothetical protein CHRYSEOSP005_18900 [Chryseobacterium sp. Alg-005]|uniref:hypothetical protein n=1 Tax=Chryseobacterium sp. Alg-005 TaxID=3159516 RepID=UPI00355582BD